MSMYTLRGSEELDAQISRHLKQIVNTVSSYCDAAILLGGYGRGEGTPFINSDGSQSPFNDYDLVVVVDKVDARIRSKFKTLEQKLSSELGLTVDLCPYQKNRLATCEFSLLNYEMKYGHMVLWGDEHILDAMPAFPHNAIPLSEGTRLLLNRGKLLLDIKLRLAQAEPLNNEESTRFLKFISKAWLALGDCALLAERKYSISYRVKREHITSIGHIPRRDTIIEEYLDAIALKEWGDYHTRLESINLNQEFKQVRNVFLEVFHWYRKHHHHARECSIVKAVLLNLRWNRRPSFAHPRRRLYEALPELLKDEPDKTALGPTLCCRRDLEERFRKLQARFS